MLVLADGDGVLRQVGEGLHDLAELVVGVSSCRFERLDLGLQSACLFGLSSCVGLCLRAAALAISSVSLLRWALSVSTWVMASRRSRSIAGKIAENGGGIHAARAQFFFDKGEVGPDKC